MWKTTSVKHSSLNSSHQLSFEECIIDTLILRFIRLYTIHLYESSNTNHICRRHLLFHLQIRCMLALYTYNDIKLGVYFQLVYLSTPIMTTYSSEAIQAIKYMAVIFANIILSTVVLRAAKNYINMRIVCGIGMETMS